MENNREAASNRREAKKRSGDDVPGQGFGDEIPNVPFHLRFISGVYAISKWGKKVMPCAC